MNLFKKVFEDGTDATCICGNKMGHAATKPDKVNIGITKDFGDQ